MSIKNTVYGMAFGDSWGHYLEFYPYEKIMEQPRPFPMDANITDDTQMSLYAMTAIVNDDNRVFTKFLRNPSQINANRVRKSFMQQFMKFGVDSDNNRAPGKACMSAIIGAIDNPDRLSDGQEFTQWNSKGCGANMRNPWFGVLPYTKEQIAYLSVLQCETTHSHQLGVASAIVTALCVQDINSGTTQLFEIGGAQWLKNIIAEAKTFDYGRSVHRVLVGLTELEDFVDSKKGDYDDFLHSPHLSNICDWLGEGWVAEEALLCAVGALERYGKQGDTKGLVRGLQRLVLSSGDSDSIAAIGGAMLGANMKDEEPLPDWETHLEQRYRDELKIVIQKMGALKPVKIVKPLTIPFVKRNK